MILMPSKGQYQGQVKEGHQVKMLMSVVRHRVYESFGTNNLMTASSLILQGEGSMYGQNKSNIEVPNFVSKSAQLLQFCLMIPKRSFIFTYKN